MKCNLTPAGEFPASNRRNDFGLIRWSWSLCLILVIFHASTQNGSSSPVPPKAVEDAFIPLAGWAGENHFKFTAPKGNSDIILTGKSDTLRFKTDSMLAEIDGVHVWLCDPIALAGGSPCISRLDLAASIQPILFPKTNSVEKPLTTICLDPGHGGKDTGGIFGKYMEKHYTLPLAEELAQRLKAAGFKMLLTRTNDTYIELENRPALANREKADLFISLHFNIGPPGQARGVEVYCLSPAEASSTNDKARQGDTASLPGNQQDAQNILLAYQLQKSLVTSLGVEDRGMRRARFEVLRSAKMPAVLIEGGFLSDSGEQKKIADPKYRTQLAAAIVRGVLNYQHLVEKRQPASNPA
jgi:N-acetylmuramoyl-L-alanine amidase